MTRARPLSANSLWSKWVSYLLINRKLFDEQQHMLKPRLEHLATLGFAEGVMKRLATEEFVSAIITIKAASSGFLCSINIITHQSL